MATETVTTNGGKGNGIPEGFKIVDATTSTGGHYDACGKCGARLHTGHMDEEARGKMADALDQKVIEPLALLAGLMANVKDEDEGMPVLSDAGYLLGLVVQGARRELKIQRVGGYGAYMIARWIGEADEI